MEERSSDGERGSSDYTASDDLLLLPHHCLFSEENAFSLSDRFIVWFSFTLFAKIAISERDVCFFSLELETRNRNPIYAFRILVFFFSGDG